jgi:hypothetical protein
MRLLLLFALFAAVAAPTASAGLPNPCTLLTNAEVANVLGSPIETREVSGNGKYHTCKWTGKNLARPDALPSQRSLMVQLTASTKARFLKGAKETPGSIRVNGIGEAAYTTTGVLRYLDVQQHGYALWIIAGDVSDPLAAEKAAAKTAVTHL